MLKGNKLGRGSLLSSISELKFNIDKNDKSFIEMIDKLKKIKSSFIKNSNEVEWFENVIKPYKRIFNSSEVPEWLSSYYNFVMNPTKNNIASSLEDSLLLSGKKGDPYAEELDVYYWLNSIFLLNSSIMLDKNKRPLMLQKEIKESYDEWHECQHRFNKSRRELQIKENNFYNELLKNEDIMNLIEFLAEKRIVDDPFSKIYTIFVFQIVYSFKKNKIIIKNYMNSIVDRRSEFVIDDINLTQFHVDFEEKIFEKLINLFDENDVEGFILSVIQEKIDLWSSKTTKSMLEDSFIPKIRDFEFKTTTSELYKDEDLLKMINGNPLISTFLRSAFSESEKERLASLINQAINS